MDTFCLTFKVTYHNGRYSWRFDCSNIIWSQNSLAPLMLGNLNMIQADLVTTIAIILTCWVYIHIGLRVLYPYILITLIFHQHGYPNKHYSTTCTLHQILKCTEILVLQYCCIIIMGFIGLVISTIAKVCQKISTSMEFFMLQQVLI